jgi:outer membrane protein TolC
MSDGRTQRSALSRVSPWVLVCFAVAAPALVRAQSPAATPVQVLTLADAMQYALDHYPTIRVALEQVNASSAGVNVAKAAYLPRLDSLWQSNRATANNIAGQVLPQSVIPALTGPVLPTTSGQSVWSSATGALFTWEPVDFGLRKAGVAGAEAAVGQARAGEALTRLDVQAAVANAFLGILSAQRAVVAAQADVDRRDTLARAVHALVDNQLRPGADASRIDAERAAAQTRFIQARAGLTVAQATLVRLLGLTGGGVTIEAASLLDRVPSADLTAGAPAAHPLVQVHQAAIDAVRAREDVLARTDFPRVYLQSSVFARGSGADANGTFDGGVGGLGLERANWAGGVQIVFPNVFDFSSLRARKSEAAALERAERARYDEAMLTVTNQQQVAAAIVEASRAVALNTPVQLAAARQSEAQATARYQAGLASIVVVADAQNLLAQAEFQDQIARVDVWRALLAEASAQGSFTSFLNLVGP